MEKESRQTLLTKLLFLSQPLGETMEALAGYGWDSDQELVTLELNHVENVLRRYLADELSAELVEKWADSVEGRDDIGIAEENEDLIKDVLFSLANPVIMQPLTKGFARSILSRLQLAGRGEG